MVSILWFKLIILIFYIIVMLDDVRLFVSTIISCDSRRQNLWWKFWFAKLESLSCGTAWESLAIRKARYKYHGLLRHRPRKAIDNKSFKLPVSCSTCHASCETVDVYSPMIRWVRQSLKFLKKIQIIVYIELKFLKKIQIIVYIELKF